MSAGRRVTALMVAAVWAGTCGTAAAAGGSGADLIRDEGVRGAAAVAEQARVQGLVAWRAEQTAAFEAAVRQAEQEAERALRAARSAASPDSRGTTVAASGSAGRDWAAEIAEALRTPAPRPKSEPTVDPEHQQFVEDSFTHAVKDLTYSPAP
ncbi:hypothetical protein JS756_08960 [Streptomyces actuosus]|uniref:Uncharacterized protein n=1 Tax=Streptomyces actuosus TaxID=1885 RepID=A0ABS2VMB9_STRAS|nr:hypothetical protein [Streptomyces actuosus]MBN0044236.1 hypothetical protein [Streptomyces actuosus]